MYKETEQFNSTQKYKPLIIYFIINFLILSSIYIYIYIYIYIRAVNRLKNLIAINHMIVMS